jgi:hypothetical protein
MSEQESINPNVTKSHGDYTRPPFPEALLDPNQRILILNLHEPFVRGSSTDEAARKLRFLFKAIENPTTGGVVDTTQEERSRQFEDSIQQELTIAPGVTSFKRTTLLELPQDMYAVTKEATDVAWARLAVWDKPAYDAVSAFGLTKEVCDEAEIVIIPPHRNSLIPYIGATQLALGKTPHFALYTEQLYSGYVNWQVIEHREGQRNYIGKIASAM